MSNEFLLEVFFIKIKVKGYLENIEEKNKISFNTFAIKNKNTITYINDETKITINVQNNKLIMTRDNQEFSHQSIFELNKEYETEYYIKELNSSIFIPIRTTNIKITDNIIEIHYTNISSNEEFIYVIEMSEK